MYIPKGNDLQYVPIFLTSRYLPMFVCILVSYIVVIPYRTILIYGLSIYED